MLTTAPRPHHHQHHHHHHQRHHRHHHHRHVGRDDPAEQNIDQYTNKVTNWRIPCCLLGGRSVSNTTDPSISVCERPDYSAPNMPTPSPLRPTTTSLSLVQHASEFRHHAATPMPNCLYWSCARWRHYLYPK